VIQSDWFGVIAQWIGKKGAEEKRFFKDACGTSPRDRWDPARQRPGWLRSRIALEPFCAIHNNPRRTNSVLQGLLWLAWFELRMGKR
jgi:hypothetical protein